MSNCERCNPFNGEFSATALQCASCPRKYYYQKILRLKPAYVPVPLNFGIAIHESVKVFYDMHMKEDFEVCKREAVKKFISVWNSFNHVGDEKRNLNNGILIMNNYCDNYRNDVAEFQVDRVECSQWLPMDNNTMLLVKLDRVRNQDNFIRVTDTKTTSGYITERLLSQWEHDFQFGLYSYAVARIFGRCDVIQVDAIKVPPPGPRSQTAPFGRRDYFYSEEQIKEVLNTYNRKTEFIMTGLQLPPEKQLEYFYQEFSHCSDYGSCSYKPLCMYGVDNVMAMSNFVVEEVA